MSRYGNVFSDYFNRILIRLNTFFAKIYLAKTWKIICSQTLIHAKVLKLGLAKINPMS